MHNENSTHGPSLQRLISFIGLEVPDNLKCIFIGDITGMASTLLTQFAETLSFAGPGARVHHITKIFCHIFPGLSHRGRWRHSQKYGLKDNLDHRWLKPYLKINLGVMPKSLQRPRPSYPPNLDGPQSSTGTGFFWGS